MKSRAAVLLGAFCLAPAGFAAPVLPRVTLSMEAFGNPTDAGPAPSCQASGTFDMGSPASWWIAVQAPAADAKAGKGSGATIRCGAGPADSAPADSYFTASVSASASPFAAATLIPDVMPQVRVSVAARKPSGAGSASGQPSSDPTPDVRDFYFVDHGAVVLPLLVSNDKDRLALRLHEVLVKVQVGMAATPPVGYGTVSISTDLGDGTILLDGGAVGKVTAGKATVLTTVLAGEREITLRDASGKELHRIVQVEPHRTAMVTFHRQDPATDPGRFRLEPLGRNPQGSEEFRRVSDGAVVVKVPGGEFLMGNPQTEGHPAEHHVSVTEFLMDKTAVTWRQFKQFAGETGGSLPPHEPYWGTPDDQPAAFVTWEEAKAYCEWAGGRLPTEAEREKAARGTDGRKYPWGNEEPTPNRGTFRHNWGDVATDPVGTHPDGVSPYGLLDMGGEVWEFTADWYDPNYYDVSPKQDPTGPLGGQAQVVRGGSWDSRPTVLSASCRNWAYRGYREGDFGFRCAMNSPGAALPQPPAASR